MGRGKNTLKSVFSQNTTPKKEAKKVVEKPEKEELEQLKEEKELVALLKEEKELVEQPLDKEDKELVEQPLDKEDKEDVVIKEPKLRSFAELSSEELRLFDRTGILPRE